MQELWVYRKCGKLIKKHEAAQIVMFVIISVKKEYITRKYHVNRKGCLQVRKLGSQKKLLIMNSLFDGLTGDACRYYTHFHFLIFTSPSVGLTK